MLFSENEIFCILSGIYIIELWSPRSMIAMHNFLYFSHRQHDQVYIIPIQLYSWQRFLG